MEQIEEEIPFPFLTLNKPADRERPAASSVGQHLAYFFSPLPPSMCFLAFVCRSLLLPHEMMFGLAGGKNAFVDLRGANNSSGDEALPLLANSRKMQIFRRRLLL